MLYYVNMCSEWNRYLSCCRFHLACTFTYRQVRKSASKKRFTKTWSSLENMNVKNHQIIRFLNAYLNIEICSPNPKFWYSRSIWKLLTLKTIFSTKKKLPITENLHLRQMIRTFLKSASFPSDWVVFRKVCLKMK